MSFINMLKQKMGLAAPSTRKIAKDRLSIMLVHQRNSEVFANVDMVAFQNEVSAVVRKYIKLADGRPSHFALKHEGIIEYLEMNFQLEDGGNSQRR